jgi:hypothetical protein
MRTRTNEANMDVRMLIPPKLLANGLRVRGGAEVPEAATASGVDTEFFPDTALVE